MAFSDADPLSTNISIYLFNLKTGEKRKLTTPPPGDWGDWDPRFSPDGQTVAFKRVTDFLVDDIYLVPVAGVPRRVQLRTFVLCQFLRISVRLGVVEPL